MLDRLRSRPLLLVLCVALVLAMVLFMASSSWRRMSGRQWRLEQQNREGSPAFAQAVQQVVKNVLAARAKSSTAASSSSDNVVIMVMVVTWGFRDMAWNLLLSIRALHLDEYVLVVAVDDRSAEFFQLHGFVTYRRELSQLGTGTDFDINSAGFNVVTVEKVASAYRVARLGHGVLVADADMLWQSSPLPMLCTDCDVHISSENTDVVVGDSRQGSSIEYINSGFYYVRPTPRGVKLLEEVLDEALLQVDFNDQASFQNVLHGKVVPGLKAVGMDVLQVPNGMVYFLKRLPQRERVTPMVIHNNWITGSAAKVYRFKENLMWHLDVPEYHESKKYVTYTHNMRELFSSWSRGRRTVDRYFDEFTYFKESLRSAFAVARVLDRTLILPRFECSRIYGHDSCDVDAFFAANVLLKHADIREHSFLANTHVDSQVRAGATPNVCIARLDERGIEWCDAVRSSEATFRPADPASGATDAEVRHWFEQSSLRVLHFDSMFRRFHKFEKSSDQADFDEWFSTAVREMRLPHLSDDSWS